MRKFKPGDRVVVAWIKGSGTVGFDFGTIVDGTDVEVRLALSKLAVHPKAVVRTPLSDVYTVCFRNGDVTLVPVTSISPTVTQEIVNAYRQETQKR